MYRPAGAEYDSDCLSPSPDHWDRTRTNPATLARGQAQGLWRPAGLGGVGGTVGAEMVVPARARVPGRRRHGPSQFRALGTGHGTGRLVDIAAGIGL